MAHWALALSFQSPRGSHCLKFFFSPLLPLHNFSREIGADFRPFLIFGVVFLQSVCYDIVISLAGRGFV